MDGTPTADKSIVHVKEHKEDCLRSKQQCETSNCTSDKNTCGQNAVSELQGLDVSLNKLEVDSTLSLHQELCPPELENAAFKKRLPYIFKKRPNLFQDGIAKYSKRPGLEDSTAPCLPPTNETFSEIFCYIHSSSVTDWLESAYISMTMLRRWCDIKDNFVQFAHFWLSDVPYPQMLNLLTLEVGIIEDEFYFAFRKALYSGALKLSDLQGIRSAILTEYPGMLSGRRGQCLFLDYLILMSSEHSMEYKNMLSNVKNATNDHQITQVLLAMRAYALSSVWHAVVQFYETLRQSQTLQGPSFRSFTPVVKKRKKEVIKERALQSVQLGYVDVLHYLIKQHLFDPCTLDESKRNLIFLAVIYNQPNVLEYIYEKVFQKPDINQMAENGNTPLHAAVTFGNTRIVSMLLSFPRIHVNALNHDCGGASAFHLAVTYGHLDICHLLIEAGADTESAVEGVTPAQLAHELGHEDISDLLKQNVKNEEH